MSRYRPYAAAYAALYRRQRDSVDDDSAVRAIAARILVNQDCAAGKHRPETDAETGNEVCRYCGTVTDDYSDTGLT